MLKKHWLYFRYLTAHKYYVGVECFKHGLYWQGIIHDWSKFLPSEWFSYVERFYGDGKILDKDEPQFRKSWLLHQHRNPHHWQYWVLRNDNGDCHALEIPRKYALELYCDWIGAGKSITGKLDIKEWYERNKYIIIFHPDTRKFIEALIYNEETNSQSR